MVPGIEEERVVMFYMANFFPASGSEELECFYELYTPSENVTFIYGM